MSTTNLHRLAGIVLAALLGVSAPALAGSPKLSNLVVFGDSLSDSGSAHALTGSISRTPWEVIPSAVYATGGLHFSNGKTWIEQRPVAKMNAHSFSPAYKQRGVFTNYAVGGARARAGAAGLVEGDLSVQVADYLSDFGASRAEATHVIFIGGNDIRDALTNPAQAFPILGAAVGAIAYNIEVLYGAGVRNILVINAPDLGLVPAVRLAGPAAQAGATALSGAFNQFLAQNVGLLGGALPGLNIDVFDLFSTMRDIVAHPTDFGLINTTDMCIIPGVSGRAHCKRPQNYLFWDGIHPTAAGHDILADYIGQAIEALTD